jgi:hypothetical protein
MVVPAAGTGLKPEERLASRGRRSTFAEDIQLHVTLVTE